MSIENPTLAHFRHFSSLFTNLSPVSYYNIFPMHSIIQNKAKTNPIKANFKKAKMNVSIVYTKDYRKNDAFAVQKNKPNSNPIFLRTKTNATLFATKDYENEPPLRTPAKNRLGKGRN